MIRKAKLVVALIALQGAGLASAADLVSVYREALVSDAQFASARSAYLAGREKIVQGKAGLLPQITANASWNYTNLDAKFINGGFPGAGGQRDFPTRAYGVQLTQPLYRPQNYETFEQSKLQAQVAEIQLNAAAQDLMVRVSQGYFDVLLARANLAFIRSQKTAIAEQLAQAKRNFIVGTATITDTNDAQARFDLSTAQEVAALNELEVKNRALAAIIGKSPGPLALPVEPIVLSGPDPVDMNTWVGQAELTSLQVELQRASVEIAKREVNKQKGGHMPTLDAVASYNDTRANASTFGFGSEVRQTVIGLQASLPIYLGGSVDSRVREAVANKSRAENDLEQARRTAVLNTQQAYLGVTSGLAQGKALEQALQSSLVSLDSTKVGRDVGVRTSVDVLNAQQQVANARRDLAKARYDTILAQLKLKQAVGRLTAEDLEAVNRLLKHEGE